MSQEADISINGIQLSEGQSLTFRVALSAFLTSLDEGLGDDEHGKAMTKAYKQRTSEILKYIHKGKI